jgi:hypothetical protein
MNIGLLFEFQCLSIRRVKGIGGSCSNIPGEENISFACHYSVWPEIVKIDWHDGIRIIRAFIKKD